MKKRNPLTSSSLPTRAAGPLSPRALVGHLKNAAAFGLLLLLLTTCSNPFDQAGEDKAGALSPGSVKVNVALAGASGQRTIIPSVSAETVSIRVDLLDAPSGSGGAVLHTLTLLPSAASAVFYDVTPGTYYAEAAALDAANAEIAWSSSVAAQITGLAPAAVSLTLVPKQSSGGSGRTEIRLFWTPGLPIDRIFGRVVSPGVTYSLRFDSAWDTNPVDNWLASVDLNNGTATLAFDLPSGYYLLEYGLGLVEGAPDDFTQNPPVQYDDPDYVYWPQIPEVIHVYDSLRAYVESDLTANPHFQFPTVPSTLGVSGISSGHVELTWADAGSVNSDYYVVERVDEADYLADGFSGSSLLSSPTIDTQYKTFQDFDVVVDQAYYYRVAATNRFGTTHSSALGPVTIPDSGPTLYATINLLDLNAITWIFANTLPTLFRNSYYGPTQMELSLSSPPGTVASYRWSVYGSGAQAVYEEAGANSAIADFTIRVGDLDGDGDPNEDDILDETAYTVVLEIELSPGDWYSESFGFSVDQALQAN